MCPNTSTVESATCFSESQAARLANINSGSIDHVIDWLHRDPTCESVSQVAASGDDDFPD
jgi:hypothetical protein